MNIVPASTPLVIKKMFPNYVWNIETDQNALYLTFDDGPTPGVTEWVLDILQKFNAQATFFCIGDNIKKYPDIFKKIVANGHTVGNHTHNHLKGWKTPTPSYLRNVEQAQQTINQKPSLFRPPYGKLKPKQGTELTKLGYKIIMWSVLSFDWDKSISQSDCFNNVKNHANPGGIIVFHDSLKAENNLRYALPKTLEYFKEKGFTFKKL